MSRSPVSEAVKLLASQGFITMQTKRGFSVRVYSDEEILNMLEVKATLEGLAGYKAAENITTSNKKLLEQHLQDYKGAIEVENYSKAKLIDYHLHHLIAVMADNSYLEKEIDKLWQHGNMYIDKYLNEAPHKTTTRFNVHADIVSAIISGNKSLSQELCATHGIEFYTMVKSVFNEKKNQNSGFSKIMDLDAAKNALSKF
jgi:DNA-binding GntR family transcriptional regulator